MISRFLPLCLFLLAGCVAEYPKDMKLVSVVPMNMQEVPNFGTLDEVSSFSPHGQQSYGIYYWWAVEQKAIKGQIIGKKDLEPFLANYQPSIFKRKLLKVGLKTKENLFGEPMTTDRFRYGIHAYFCNRPTINVQVGSFFIEDSGVPFLGDVPIVKDNEGFYTYYKFIVTQRKLGGSITGKVDVDLQNDPEDVCFAVKGRNIFGFGTRGGPVSNEVVLSKEIIEKALRK